MKTNAKYVIVGDFETGGLPNKNLKAFYDVALCEVALCVIDMEKLEIIDEYNEIFAPHYKEGLTYDPGAFEATGMSMELLENKGIPLKEIFRSMKDIFKKYKNPRQGCTLCGHNWVKFDMPFLENMFEFMGDDIYNYVTFTVDTMMMAHWSSLEQTNYKLGTCCELNGINLVGAHRALADTRANAELLIEYIKKLRGEGVNFVNSGNEENVNFREIFKLQIPNYLDA